MRYENNEKQLRIYLSGKIDSENAREIESEIAGIIEKEEFEELCFDFSELSYISSAGLRVFMALAKKYKEMFIENVSVEVWDIFDMTGMNQIINVRKKLREISLDGAKIIGDGFFSKVYRIDEETIVKQYIRDPDISEVYRELNLAKQAFIQGIPTAISYDVVMADAHYGVVFEMISGGSLRDLILSNYGVDFEKTKALFEEHGNLLKTINETPVLDPLVPSAKARFLNRIENGKSFFAPETFKKLKGMVDAIPEEKTYVHGDCHIKNIMCDAKGDFALIDMDTLSYGNPVFELLGVNSCYNAFEIFDPGNNERFLGVKREIIVELYSAILNVYFAKKSAEEISEIQAKLEVMSAAHMVVWFSENLSDQTDMIKKYSARLDEIIDTVSNLVVEV